MDHVLLSIHTPPTNPTHNLLTTNFSTSNIVAICCLWSIRIPWLTLPIVNIPGRLLLGERIVNTGERKNKNILFMKQTACCIDVSLIVTLCVVSFTLGNGKRGNDPWKLYSPGVFQLDNTLVTAPQILVPFDIVEPLPLDSYIHPLYISKNFSVYRIV